MKLRLIFFSSYFLYFFSSFVLNITEFMCSLLNVLPLTLWPRNRRMSIARQWSSTSGSGSYGGHKTQAAQRFPCQCYRAVLWSLYIMKQVFLLMSILTFTQLQMRFRSTKISFKCSFLFV